jgi:soluble lytic murein transglycosylase-like protein
MQINTYWLTTARLDRERLLTDACYNTKAGARILRDCIDRHGYTWEAVGCYNATSSDKRRNYAWKVYRQLESAGKKQQQLPPTAAQGGKAGTNRELNSSLTVSFEERQSNGQWSSYPETGN